MISDFLEVHGVNRPSNPFFAPQAPSGLLETKKASFRSIAKARSTDQIFQAPFEWINKGLKQTGVVDISEKNAQNKP